MSDYLPYQNLLDLSMKDRLIVVINALECIGCGNSGNAGSSQISTDGGMKQIIIETINRLSCYSCGG